jgi:hypothetical protein
MIDESPFPTKISFGDKYGPAMEIDDPADAKAYFAKCVAHTLAYWAANPAAFEKYAQPGEARELAAARMEQSNLGYFSGYYGPEERARFARVFRIAHPIFGHWNEHEVSPEEAFEAGLKMSREVAAERDKKD